ncbi:YfiR family protein [Ideonella sp. 4Y11]|uniref:YfiR family protein n=1 Tax=Ideonella aquatica TaxID=2824119 RepID=A0A940YL10_9BURK|nr:YfiR family protein [Ideonella aquatica]MBQ0958957.1 YfiR family protein [Ideonella aquatica]
MSRLRILLTLAWLAWAPCPASAAPPAPVNEWSLKAAIAYNLLLFTQWPDEERWAPGAPLVWCVDPASPWWSALQGLQERPVRQARVAMRALSRPADTAACQVIQLDAGLRQASRQGAQLLIAEGREASAPWAVRLAVQGERVVFDIDLAGLRAGGLQISSKALRLAREVRE